MALKLPRLQRVVAIVDRMGQPMVTFHQWWQSVAVAIEQSFNDLSNAVIAIQAAQDAADAAQATADTAQADIATKQDADATLTALSGRGIGAAASTDILDRAAADARYSATGTSALYATRATSSTGNVLSSDYFIAVDATAANRTLTLPDIGSEGGRVIVVKKVDASANSVTLAGFGTDTIDGAASVSTAVQYESFTVIADGTEWRVI